MSQVLVDANVLLDIFTEDPRWFDWSARALETCAATAQLCVNPLIYAEVSVGFARIEELDDALPSADFTRLPVPWDAGFLAGKAFLRYRRGKGTRRSPLPDFYIGAHAAIAGIPLLTRDATRYRTYFPTMRLICPESH
jgi:predicted nucleic acid-binding protein